MACSDHTFDSGGAEQHQPREGTKQALLVAMLSQKTGVTISELVDATGWKTNTVHAALSTFRKSGKNIVVENISARRIYRIHNKGQF